MYVLKYDIANLNSLKNFKNDLYIYLSSNLYDDTIIFDYINNYINYYEQIQNMILNFSNDINDLDYDVEFELTFDNQISHLYLKSINLEKTQKINRMTNQIKYNDYINIIKILDYNYEIYVNTNPYFIVKIIRTLNYNQHDNFYKGKYVLLKKINTNEFIDIDFEKYLIHHYDLDKYQNDFNDSSYLDSHTFTFYNKKLCVCGGPIYIITKLEESNKIMLDNEIYEIDIDSTVDIFEYI